jgi:hypothetical protein
MEGVIAIKKGNQGNLIIDFRNDVVSTKSGKTVIETQFLI